MHAEALKAWQHYLQKSMRFFSAACVTLKSGLVLSSSSKTMRTTTTLIRFPMAGSLYSDDTIFIMVSRYVSTSRSWWKSTMDGSATTSASTCRGLLTDRLLRLCASSSSAEPCNLAALRCLCSFSICSARCRYCMRLCWRCWRRFSVSLRFLRRIRFRIRRLFCTSTYIQRSVASSRLSRSKNCNCMWAYFSLGLPFDVRLARALWLFCSAVAGLVPLRIIPAMVFAATLRHVAFFLLAYSYLITGLAKPMPKPNITVDGVVLLIRLLRNVWEKARILQFLYLPCQIRKGFFVCLQRTLTADRWKTICV